MLKVLELFGGVGACRKALTNLNIDFKIVDYVEYDENPCSIYNALYEEEYDTQDITKYDKDIDVDMIVGGFPCQDISIAGKQKGIIEGETRSGLMYEMMRLINKYKPKYVITENVKNFISEKHKEQFDVYIDFLNSMGYTSKYDVMSGQYHGVPQTRERVIIVSKLDNDFAFQFRKRKITNNLEDYLDFREKDDLTFNFHSRYNMVKGVNVSEEEFLEYVDKLPTLKGIGSKKLGLYNFGEMDTVTTDNNLTGTLTCRNVQNYNKKYLHNGRLYKPSPKMCFRLMGFDDSDFEKIKNFEDKKLYNAAGNSIVVGVLEDVFRELLK